MQNLKSFLQKYSRKWYFWVLVIFIVSFIGSKVDPVPESKLTKEEAVVSTENTSHIEEVPAQQIVQTPTEPKQTEAKKEIKYLPGLLAVDVYGNLKNLDFDCSRVKVGSDKLLSWTCEETTNDHYYIVQIVGQDTDEIISIQATAQYYGSGDINTEVDDFLGYVASVTYADNKPAEAKAWVKQNIGKNTVTDFGSGHFELFGNGRTRILRIMPVH